MIIQNQILMVIADAVHPKFTLNGISYGKVDLKELGDNLVKEGKSFEKSIGSFLLAWLDVKSTLQVKTSGSTGKPKNILLQKRHMLNSALATGKYFDLTEGNTALLCLPVDYIAGKMMLVRAMVLGLNLDYVEPSSSPLAKHSKAYDFAAMIPLQVQNSLAKIEQIKTIIVGGAAVSESLREKVKEKRTAVFETYGMTETITHVAVKKITSSNKPNNFKAISNITFSADDRACLIISAPKVSDHKIITNDVINLFSETEFEWLGRYDNVINSGGIKLYPEQIENKLAPLLNNRFFVAGVPDERLGQKLILVIEGDINSEALFQKISETVNLDKFEIPKEVCVVANFVNTDSGKIHRRKSLILLNK